MTSCLYDPASLSSLGHRPGSPGVSVSGTPALVVQVNACLPQCSVNSFLADAPVMQERPGEHRAGLVGLWPMEEAGWAISRPRAPCLSPNPNPSMSCVQRRGGLCSRVRLGPILPRRLPRRAGAGVAIGRVFLLRTVLGAVASGSVNWNRRARGALLMQQWVLPGTLWVPSTLEQSPSRPPVPWFP